MSKLCYCWRGNEFIIQEETQVGNERVVQEVRFSYEEGDRIWDKFSDSQSPAAEHLETMEREDLQEVPR